MSVGRTLYRAAAVTGALLLLASAPASARKFVPEGAEVTGTGEEANFFSNEINCHKNKFTGKAATTMFVSKVEGTIVYEECKFGSFTVQNFSIVNFAIEANERVSFREAKMKVENTFCTVTILPLGENLKLSTAEIENEHFALMRVKINVPGTERGILFKTSQNECGNLEKLEKELGTYTGTEHLSGANIE